MRNLLDEVRIQRVSAPVVAGQTDVDSDVVDTQGVAGVAFLVHFGAITSGAATAVKLQQSAASDGSGMADLEGSKVTVADTDDSKIVPLCVCKPQKRYVRCVVTRATQDSVLNSIVALFHGATTEPVVNGSTVTGTKTLISPAEGTA